MMNLVAKHEYVTLGNGDVIGIWRVMHPDGRVGTAVASNFTKEQAISEMARQFTHQDAQR